jgi:hypothetical protein
MIVQLPFSWGQSTKLYDKGFELVYYKKFDNSIKLLEKIVSVKT